MKRLLYTLGLSALIFEGYVVYDICAFPRAPTQPAPPSNVSTHAKNIPATPDPVYSALKKEPIIGAKQSAEVWQKIFSHPLTYAGARK
jgi:hypothetical protein